MRVDPHSGLLDAARQLPSPNHNERPAGTPVDLVVVHGISLPPGEYGGPYIDQLFTNALDPTAHPYFARLAGLRVSAHLLLRRDGSLTQYVSFGRRAWHAGASSFRGRDDCNDYSVGIELEGSDEEPYPPVQYRALSRVLTALMGAYPAITPARVVGHSDVAPGRKTDPGPHFDWALLRRLL